MKAELSAATLALGLSVALGASALPGGARPSVKTTSGLGDSPFAQVVDVRLTAQGDLRLLRRFVEPWVERPGEWRNFYSGRFGPKSWIEEPRLDWRLGGWDGAPAASARIETSSFASSFAPSSFELAPSSFELAPVARLSPPNLRNAELLPLWQLEAAPSVDAAFVHATQKPRCQPWQHPYSVTLARYGAERDSFSLLECDGSVALDALDRLSVLARPTGVERPELPLPLEPAPESEVLGEWVPNVRLLDPRLLWVLARISEAFPYRPIYIISGYRRDAHGSLHQKGRALDLFVMGVANDQVLKICRTLKDVGCGYYPNNKFLHVDVRPPETGHAIWIDVSLPGQPSHYVDGWPGVVESGALSWGGSE